MDRRGFLSSFLKGTILTIAAPQIVIHGLKLKSNLIKSSRWLPNNPNNLPLLYNKIPPEILNNIYLYIEELKKESSSEFKMWRKLNTKRN